MLPLDPNEGRISRSWRLIGRCWDVLTERPRLLVMPVVSALATAIAAVAILLPMLWWTRGLPAKVSVVIATAAASLPFTLISTTTNVALLAMVEAHFAGREPRVRDGLRVAWRRRWAILGWSVLASGVGSVLGALQELPGVDWLGRVLGFLGGFAWGLATIFVVPVLALEGVGPIEAVRRSAGVFRERWGETLSGELTIGAALGFVMIPGFVVAGAGLVAFDDASWVTGAVLLSIGIVLIAPVLALQVAMSELFQYVLYRGSTTGEFPGPFDEGDVALAFTRRRRLWRRD